MSRRERSTNNAPTSSTEPISSAEVPALIDPFVEDCSMLVWRNASSVVVRVELCSLDSSIVYPLEIAPAQRLRAPAVFAEHVRTRAPQLVLVED